MSEVQAAENVECPACGGWAGAGTDHECTACKGRGVVPSGAGASVKPRRLRRSLIRRTVDGLFGVDTWFFWKTKQKSKLLRVRCLLLGGHRHEWKKLRGGGSGWDALICTRCCCHIAEYRETQLHE